MSGVLDLKKFRRNRAEYKAAKDVSVFYSAANGRTILYVAPPTEEMEGLPYVEAHVHRNVGADNKTVICLREDNPLFANPAFAKYLKEKGVEIGVCDVCDTIESDSPTGFSDDKLKKMERKPTYVFPIVPLFALEEGEKVPLPDVERFPRILMAGPQIWDQVCDVIDVEGNITNPDEAVLLMLQRSGEKMTTKYVVKADSESLKAPIRIEKGIRAAVAQDVKPGGECDPLRILAVVFLKAAADVKKFLRGEMVETRRAVETGPSTPRCFGFDCDPEDPECVSCPHKEKCAEKCKVAVPGAKKRGSVEAEPAPAKRETRKADPEPDPEPAPRRRAAPEPEREPYEGDTGRTVEDGGERRTTSNPGTARKTRDVEPEPEPKPEPAARKRRTAPDPEPEPVKKPAPAAEEEGDGDEPEPAPAKREPAKKAPPVEDDDPDNDPDLAAFEASIRDRKKS